MHTKGAFVLNKKHLSLILSLIIIASSLFPTSALAEETTVPQESETQQVSVFDTDVTDSEDESKEASLSLKEQQAKLEKQLAQTEIKLAELEKSSKNTQEYIDTLDRKIGYINRQLEVFERQINNIEKEIKELTPLIEENEAKLEDMKIQLDKAQREYDEMQERFNATYEAYCYRLKVIYMSGQFNIISALLSCKDLSGFLTRYEMIRSISKSDAKLLKEVQSRMAEIETRKNGLDEIKADFDLKQRELDAEKNELVSKEKTIENNRNAIASKKANLSIDRAECDRLLAQLNAENKQYTEFRNEDEELVAQVENEIQALIQGVITPEEVTTVTSDKSKVQEEIKENEKLDVYSKSDAVLNMIYPVPNHKSISAGFPNYSSGRYHGGIDFPCPTGSKVVAVQKGIVITVKRLDYSYGYYVMIYHGTDKSGRSVVSLYAHNSSILVNPGDSVSKGDVIAKSGSTGNSTGPHSHFEIRLNGGRVNPRIYLS